MAKRCDECRFGLEDDAGYSNYTVENTYFHCLKKLHPESGFDMFYGEDKRLSFAEECPSYEKGEPIQIDVDREGQSGDQPLSAGYVKDDPEVAALVDAWDKEP